MYYLAHALRTFHTRKSMSNFTALARSCSKLLRSIPRKELRTMAKNEAEHARVARNFNELRLSTKDADYKTEFQRNSRRTASLETDSHDNIA